MFNPFPKLLVVIANVSPSSADDRNYPAFPKLVLESSKIKQLDFWMLPSKHVG